MYNINYYHTHQPVIDHFNSTFLGETLPADITSSGFVMIPAGTKMRMYHARLMARHLPMLGSPEMKLEAIFEEARAKFMDF